MSRAAAKAPAPPPAANGIRYPWAQPPEPGELREVVPGLHWLRMPLPFALDHINLWLAEDGDGWTVIDTGTATGKAKEIWRATLARIGRNLPVRRVIVTHLHPDHIGLAGWFSRKYGAELWMSRTDYLMCRMLATDTGKDAPREALDFYRAAGFGEDQISAYEERFGGFGMLISRLPDSYRRLTHGETITIGASSWAIVVGAGHAPEHICLYDKARRLFISGDQVLPRISSNVSVFPTEPAADPLGDWLHSCRALGAQIPDDVLVLPAHNEPFHGLHARLKALIDNHEKALARLMEMCAAHPRRAVDLFPALFRRRVDRSLYMMAVGESIAHLNYLIRRNKITAARDADGINWYSATDAERQP